MNWLAHLYLSEDDIHFQLGNILADPLKGKTWEGAPEKLIRGMAVHGKIDAFTDSHEVVKRSKARFTTKRYLKGVVVDIIYDHFLTKHWNSFSPIDRSVFIADFYSKIEDAIQNYPQEAQDFSRSLVNSDRLNRYVSLADVEQSFTRVDTRLSPKLIAKETCVSYMPLIQEHYAELEEDFLTFFPELKSYVNSI